MCLLAVNIPTLIIAAHAILAELSEGYADFFYIIASLISKKGKKALNARIQARNKALQIQEIEESLRRIRMTVIASDLDDDNVMNDDNDNANANGRKVNNAYNKDGSSRYGKRVSDNIHTNNDVNNNPLNDPFRARGGNPGTSASASSSDPSFNSKFSSSNSILPRFHGTHRPSNKTVQQGIGIGVGVGLGISESGGGGGTASLSGNEIVMASTMAKLMATIDEKDRTIDRLMKALPASSLAVAQAQPRRTLSPQSLLLTPSTTSASASASASNVSASASVSSKNQRHESDFTRESRESMMESQSNPMHSSIQS